MDSIVVVVNPKGENLVTPSAPPLSSTVDQYNLLNNCNLTLEEYEERQRAAQTAHDAIQAGDFSGITPIPSHPTSSFNNKQYEQQTETCFQNNLKKIQERAKLGKFILCDIALPLERSLIDNPIFIQKCISKFQDHGFQVERKNAAYNVTWKFFDSKDGDNEKRLALTLFQQALQVFRQTFFCEEDIQAVVRKGIDQKYQTVLYFPKIRTSRIDAEALCYLVKTYGYSSTIETRHFYDVAGYYYESNGLNIQLIHPSVHQPNDDKSCCMIL